MVKRKSAKKATAKKTTTKKKTIKKSTGRESYKVSQVKDDAKQRRKYARGGRIEAYTFGEAIDSKGWP